jgi:Uma2 family endonuclease
MSSDRDAAKRPVTYQDLLDLPDHVVGEILSGELHVSPRPAIRHANAGSVLGGGLNSAFHQGSAGPGGWWILYEPELHLAEDVVVPDLAGWRRERLPRLPDEAYLTLAPDWVCEILSPSTERIDRLKKLRIYAREAISHAWLVNPDARTLEVFRLDGGHWMLLATHGEEEVVRAEPFEAIEIELGRLWAME